MRIGVNLLPLFPGQVGGMERYTFELLAHLMEIDDRTPTGSVPVTSPGSGPPARP
jgi:hypothetical protein